MKKQKMYRATVMMTRELADKLRERAKLNNRSMVAEIREILETVTGSKEQEAGK